MPHISKKRIDKDLEKDLLKSFNLTLTKISDLPQMETFLGSLLTPTERIMLAKRLAIAILLKENIPQTRISAILNVTQATVSRMQLFLEARGDVGYGIALRKLENEKSLSEFKKILLRLVKYSVRAGGGYVKPEIF